MALLPPRVIGPLSHCNKVVRVDGQLTGATVRILSNGAEVASGTATWSSQVFDLSPGKTLHAGDNVTATQKTASDSSQESPDPVIVQAKPPQIGSVIFANPIYACGECTGIVGAVPGATVKVRVLNSVRGTGVAPDGGAGVFLSPATGATEILIARQTACGTDGTDTSAPMPEQTNKQLPKPIIKSPLLACQSAVTIKKLLAGAVTTINRSGGPSVSGTFTVDTVNFPIDPPLAEGETVSATQAFPSCHYESQPSSSVTVQKADPVPAPVLHGPLCAGAVTVSLTHLIPGSQVRILSDGQTLGTGQAPDVAFVFAVPALTSGASVTAEQELCGKWSAPSNAITVNALTADLPKPVITSPLNECGGAVHVTNVHAGAWVYVWSKDLAAPIGQVFASGSWVDVPVSPLLHAGDHIHAQCVGCGGKGADSADVTVAAAPKSLKPPTVIKPVETMTTVSVHDVVPGATVDVDVNGVWRGSKTCALSTGLIPISGALVIGDKVKARQRMCSLVSQFGNAVTTVPLPPVAHFAASPTSGNVPLAVQFTDQSTGVIDSWSWNFGDGSTSGTQSPAHTYSATHGGVYTVTLTVSNAGGSASTTATITAKPLPPVAHFAASPTSGQAPITVQFTDQSTGVIDSWSWSFGDGQSSTAQSPSHQFTAGGNFVVLLTIKNLGGSSSASTTLAVQAPPLPPFITLSLFQQTVTVSGSHFPPNASVLIVFTDSIPNEIHGNTTASGVGTFTNSLFVPGCTGLGHQPLFVKATGDNGATWSNTASINC